MLSRKNLIYRSTGKIIAVTALVIFAGFNDCSKVHFNSQDNALIDMSTPNGTISINNGAPYTRTTAVQLQLNSAGSSEMYITNTAGCASGGQWQPYSSSSPWTLGAVNQTDTVYAEFRNKNLTTSPCVQASILHDDIPPTVVVDTGAPAITNVNNVNVLFHATDSGSGVDQLLCILPGQSALVPCAGAYAGNSLTDGRYILQIAASDKAGNVSAPLPQPFMVDTTPPVITLNSTPPTLTGSTTGAFTFTAMDNLSGVQGTFCSIDQSAFAACVSGQTYTNLSNGKHHFAVHAVDNAGNASKDVTYDWTVDTSAPTVYFTQTPKRFTNVPTATFGFAGKDDMGNPLTVFQCSLNGAGFATCTSPVALAGLTEGNNTFTVRGENALGVYSGNLSYTWLVDLTPPVVKITSGPNPLTNQTNATFIFTASDALSGIATVDCTLDGGTPTNCATLTQTYPSLTGDMQHTFTVTAVDTAGNVTQSAPYVWNVDTATPTLQIVAKPPTLSPSSSAAFQLLGTDPYDPTDSVTYKCRLDGASILTTCSSTPNYAGLTDGPHTFSAQAEDGAGNFSAIQTYTWTVETAGPQITIKPPTPPLNDTTPGTLSYTITDPYSTVTTATCTLDKTNITPCAVSGETVQLPILTSGSHTFTVTATNAAGFTSTQTDTFTVSHTVLTYPSIGSVAAVAYEDMYGSGSPDYDYNDFMADFQVTEKVNASNQITDIYLDFYPRTAGAGYDHEFVLALNGTVTTPANNTSSMPTTKALFSGAANIDITYYDSSGNVVSQQAPTAYNNQDVVVFSSTHGAFGQTSGQINTPLPTNYVAGSGTPSNYIKATENARIHLALANPAANPVPANGQFDVSTLRMVLHVKNTNENIDIVNVDPSFYTSAGYPWGFIIPANWQWMQEAVKIDNGYPNFAAYRQYLNGTNPSCASTPSCINWFNYPVTGSAANTTVYPQIPFTPFMPAP